MNNERAPQGGAALRTSASSLAPGNASCAARARKPNPRIAGWRLRSSLVRASTNLSRCRSRTVAARVDGMEKRIKHEESTKPPSASATQVEQQLAHATLSWGICKHNDSHDLATRARRIVRLLTDALDIDLDPTC